MSNDESKIRDAADAARGFMEATPVYQDALQPAAKQVGTALETVGKAVNVALAPIGALVWGWEKIHDWIVPALEARLAKVPPERIVTPRPTLAGPAIEALRYAGHEESLRDLYANLLATSMDAETAHSAHPAFVEILGQLTPDEAKLLRHIATAPIVTLVFIDLLARIKPDEDARPRGKAEVLRRFSTLGEQADCAFADLTPTYLDNLERLGIVELESGRWYTAEQAEAAYADLEQHPRVRELSATVEGGDLDGPEIRKGIIHVSALGRQFINACVVDRSVES